MNLRYLHAMLGFALAITPAIALADSHDRAPTAEERARIVQTLESLGYTTIGEIEIEGDEIEVDDALHADGQRYELKLDPQTLEVIHRERDD